jgi:AcrR family transcriptional regulator
LFKLMVANAQSFPAAVRQVRSNLINRVLNALQGYLQQQINAGRIRPCDTEMAARTFMGALVAYLLLKHVLQEPIAQARSVDAFVDGVTKVVLCGILPADK